MAWSALLSGHLAARLGESIISTKKSECGRHVGHRKETRGLSVGSDGVDMRKISGMLRKHRFPGSQTEEEGNKSIHTNPYVTIPTHTQYFTPQPSKSIQT